MDCSPPIFLLQERILEWGAIPFSMGSSQPRNWTWVIHIAREGNGTPLQYSCLETPMDGGALVGCSSWGCEESDTTLFISNLLFNISFLFILPYNTDLLAMDSVFIWLKIFFLPSFSKIVLHSVEFWIENYFPIIFRILKSHSIVFCLLSFKL